MKTAALLIALVLACGAADAQRTGTRLNSGAKAGDARSTLVAMVQCVAGRKPAYVDRWFATLPSSREETALVERAANGDFVTCLQTLQTPSDLNGIAFKPQTMRTHIAAELVRLQSASIPAALPVPKDSRGWWVDELARLPAGAPFNRQALGVQDFGHCVALADWDGARMLMRSRSQSAEERAAVAKLMPVLPVCIDSELKFMLTPETLRLAMAEPVYHILRGDVTPAAKAS